MWTFGRKLAAGFALSWILLLVVGAASYRGIQSLVETSRWVTHTYAVLDDVAKVLNIVVDAESMQRLYLLTGELRYLESSAGASERVAAQLADLRLLTADNPSQQERIAQAEPVIAQKLAWMVRTTAARRGSGLEAAANLVRSGEGERLMGEVGRVLASIEREERDLLVVRDREVADASSTTRALIVGGTLVCLALISVAGLLITRGVTQSVGSAIQNLESSSAELQAAANQQVTGAKEQVTAMSEISTTISEFLATSRQIAESAVRIAGIAGATSRSASAGETTVDGAHASIAAIREQVDLVVEHMLDLGKKSQQIGAVLEIVSELAEQTNILAINATIEAAGAGEAGARFAVVADEIRKLADRVAGSTKEIRGLIEDVRSAVNTTVMATEGGSKAVDVGSRQFADVATAFRQIAGLVVTTTEAAREIELSTKQQSSAVEQVNLAITSVAQATRESEASSGEVLQTASQIVRLSRALLRLIQPGAAA